MAIKLKVELKNEATPGLDQVKNSVKKLGQTVAAVSKEMEAHWGKLHNAVTRLIDKMKKLALIGIGAVTAALTKSVMSFAKSEQGYKRLETAVNIVGISFTKAKPQVDAFLASMMETTRFDDDELVPVLQEITLLTGSLQKGFAGTKLAADMAASGLFNLDQASRMVAMVMEGEVNLLGRYIPQLKDAALEAAGVTTASEKTAYALKLLNQMFSGSAQADLQTFGGAFDQLKNYLGNAYEKMGEIIAVKFGPEIRRWTVAVREWMENGGMEKLAGQIKTTLDNIVDLVKKGIDKLKEGIGWVVENKDWFVKAFNAALIAVAVIELGNIVIKIMAIKQAIIGLGIAAGASKILPFLVGTASPATATAAIGGMIIHSMNEYGKSLNTLDKSTESARKNIKLGIDKLNASIAKTKVVADSAKNALIGFGDVVKTRLDLGIPQDGSGLGAPGMSRRTRETVAPELSTGSLDETIDKLKEMEDVGKESAFSVGDAWRNSMQDMANFVGDEWSREFTDLVGKGKTFFGQLWRFVLQSFTRMLATMAAQWAAMFLTKTILNWIVPGSGTAFEKAVQGGSASMRTPQSQQVLNSSRPRQSSVVMQGDNFVVNGGDPGLAKELKLLKARNNEFLRTQIETLARQRQLSYIGI